MKSKGDFNRPQVVGGEDGEAAPGAAAERQGGGGRGHRPEVGSIQGGWEEDGVWKQEGELSLLSLVVVVLFVNL